jgi:hypothetical protein
MILIFEKNIVNEIIGNHPTQSSLLLRRSDYTQRGKHAESLTLNPNQAEMPISKMQYNHLKNIELTLLMYTHPLSLTGTLKRIRYFLTGYATALFHRFSLSFNQVAPAMLLVKM